jgi:hypothetical protein
MDRPYTLILRAPHRLDIERSETQSSFESSATAIAPLIASSRAYAPLCGCPRAPFERSARNLSNENVVQTGYIGERSDRSCVQALVDLGRRAQVH